MNFLHKCLLKKIYKPSTFCACTKTKQSYAFQQFRKEQRKSYFVDHSDLDKQPFNEYLDKLIEEAQTKNKRRKQEVEKLLKIRNTDEDVQICDIKDEDKSIKSDGPQKKQSFLDWYNRQTPSDDATKEPSGKLDDELCDCDNLAGQEQRELYLVDHPDLEKQPFTEFVDKLIEEAQTKNKRRKQEVEKLLKSRNTDEDVQQTNE